MRDPESRLLLENQHVRRLFERAPKSNHFLHSPLARSWAVEGLLPTYEWLSPTELVAERLPFVSYPHEWCDAQLHSAASLTLQLQRDAVTHGFDLKDASAWNIIFRGTTPLFCDLGSFQNLVYRIWWAGGQYARHFLVPLWLAQQGRFHISQCFKLWRDGVPSPEARRLLGPGRFLTRYWPLVAAGRETERPAEPVEAAENSSGNGVMRDTLAQHRQGFLTSLGWMLDGLHPLPSQVGGPWINYINSRDHYEPAVLEIKRRTVANWLDRTQPDWVVDFGANTGEFSLLAAEAGAQVVALDSDHDAVERIFTGCPDSLTGHIHPIVATLDDLGAGRGWAGEEFEGLGSRLHGRFDLVLMLALLHHLMIAASIPLCEIAAFAARCTRRFLIVELLGPSDPQLVRLLMRHGRDLSEFTLERQRAAFLEVGFVIEAEVDLAPTPRLLLLLRR
jgi:hypothetical protein